MLNKYFCFIFFLSFSWIVGDSDAIEENSKPKQENLDDHLDVEPTEHIETPVTTTIMEVKTTTPSKPNENTN